ncbi:VWFA domain-containing protein [Candidatus Electrothrix gigas]
MFLLPTFAQPLWLLIGLITCLAMFIFTLFNTRLKKKELKKFVAPKLLQGLTGNVSSSRRQLKNVLFIFGIACLFLALARPQYGEQWIEVRQKGIDILIGVDVSKSMLVQDIKPSRLGRAKLAIRDFVSKLEGDRVGLLPFAGTAFLMCPLTTDYEAFNASLDTLDVGSIPKGGTDIGLAIRKGKEVLSNEANHKIFVLVTDGEDLSEYAVQAAKEAKKDNMVVYTIGVGTPEGELIPVASQGQVGRFIQDAQGQFITSKLDEQTLTTLAETTGGLYAPLGSTGQGFDTIYEKKLSLIPQEEHEQRRRKIPIERFPWPLAAAVLVLSIDFLVTGRRSSRSLHLPSVKTAGRRKRRVTETGGIGGRMRILLLMLIPTATVSVLLVLGVTLLQVQQTWASEGEELFQAGDYAGAESYYQQSLEEDKAHSKEHPILYFNLGGALYRQQKYDQAAVAFTQALTTNDLSLQEQSYYNRGNCQFFLGAAAQAEDKDQALQQWNEAKKSFEAALKLQPEDKAAAHNLKMIKQKLEQLKEEMRQSGQQCDNPQEGENGKNGKDGKEDKEGEQQGQDKKKTEEEQKQQEQEKNKDNEASQSTPEEKEAGGQQEGHQQSQEEQQEDKHNKQKAVAESKAKDEEQEKAPTAEEIQKAAAAQNTEEQQMSAEDMERRMMGKMTKEEARNLLNSLKGEQGELNFIPQGMGNNESVGKDW